MLGWSRRRLAEAADVAERTLIDFERGARRPYERTLRDIRAALEYAGIEFIDDNGSGPGVRLHQPTAAG
jgi:transcriptional regulator with XRE-family HTH domain